MSIRVATTMPACILESLVRHLSPRLTSRVAEPPQSAIHIDPPGRHLVRLTTSHPPPSGEASRDDTETSAPLL